MTFTMRPAAGVVIALVLGTTALLGAARAPIGPAGDSAATTTPATSTFAPVASRMAPAIAGPTDAYEAELFFDELMARQMAQDHVVGATVAVVRGDQLMFAKGYGYANREQRLPVTADRSLFYLGSAGKLFTWTAVMQLVEQGKLDLHADVNRYLDFPIPATYPQPITLHHLMTHTAGFEENLDALFTHDQAALLPLRTFLARELPQRVYPPGTLLAYSNYGTALAGYMVERVSGEPYEQYITRHILEPLAMHQSTAVQPLPAALRAELATGYRYENGGYRATDIEWVAAAPDGVVRGPATDIAHFMIAHLNDGRYGATRILQQTTAQEMHRQHFTHDPRLSGFAYGFSETFENNQRVIWHLGESAHFVTLLVLVPEQKVGFFISYNTRPIDGRATLSAVLDHYFPATAAPGPPPPDSDQTAARLAGTYVSTRVAHSTSQKLATWGSGTLSVALADDHTLQLAGQRYTAVAPGLFQQVDGDRLLTFHEDGNGQVTHLFLGPFAYFSVPWYQNPQLQLGLLAGSLAVSLTALVAWPIDALVGWRCGRAAPARGARLARWLAGLLGGVGIGLLAWLAVLLQGFSASYSYPAEAITLIAQLCWLLAPLALGTGALVVPAWRNGYWSLRWRVHYTLVVLAAAVLLWSLTYWNLLTFPL